MSVIRSHCVSDEDYRIALRDDFAAKAMQGMLANPEICKAGNPRSEENNFREGCYAIDEQLDDIAELAYQAADEMLQERAK